jgi:rhodanese-related sulfurtransferase
MEARKILTVVLLGLGIILAILPLTSRPSFRGNPEKVLAACLDESKYLTADEVARLVVADDSMTRLIDVRSPEEYRASCLPGAINIPLERFLNEDLSSLPGGVRERNVLYSNGDLDAAYALSVAEGLHYKGFLAMKGGLNEWHRTVMNSVFTGERITARENALFETRARAGKLFKDLNSMPDSLKIKYLAERQGEAKKLDGGCE